MATAQKISELTTAGPLTGPELVPIVQNGGTVQTFVSTLAVFATSILSSDIATVSVRLDQVSAALTSTNDVVSTLEVRVSTVSAAVSANAASITSTNAVVSALDTRVASVSASVSALQIQVDAVSAALTSTNNVVSVLEIRVSNASAAIVSANAVIANVSALVSALDIRLTNVSASVSVLNGQMLQVQASISAINSVLATIDTSAITGLEVRVSNLSIAVSANTAAVTSINAVVSALDIRLAAVSASVSVNSAAITSINAVLSTKVNRVGDFMDAVQYIEFDTSTTIATSVGRIHWDIEYGTLDIGLTGGNSNVLVGQREVAYVYNNTAATLTKGKVVEVTGASGQRLTVKLAQANSDANSATVLGIMLETVSVNKSGYVATDGIVRNVNTGAFTDGQIVYLSPVSAGELTATKPVAPQHLVLIGYIVKGGSVGAGSVYVKTQNGYELGELHDVKTSSSASIANNEVIAWNTSAGVFTNSTVLIETQASVSALQIQLNAVSAATSVNTAAITSTNNVVSALEIRVSTASATGVTNSAAITSINAVLVSILAILTNTNYRIIE
jgi:predicted  nucleic acid-binding Zn-ribbon protein